MILLNKIREVNHIKNMRNVNLYIKNINIYLNIREMNAILLIT